MNLSPRRAARSLVAVAWLGMVATSHAATFVASSPSRGGEDLSMVGRVDGDDAARLDDALTEAASRGLSVRRLRLDSPGGSAKGGLLLAQAVLAHGIDTDVPDGRLCASACFIVFAAGRHRTAGPTSVLGVHGSAEDGEASERTAAIDAALAKVLSDLRVPASVVRRMLSTPPDDVYVLTRSDLGAMGVGRSRPR